ncbi:6-hydroxy-D-nicotine oxidase [Aspergillus eucalypticola CBS 122712]|uniref:6-hydroxy-D-nicotine oxidase n=1 Tax=Aspergillus eucalypticola (strain CBS 122712 / IBT 29274) TaxID=1448314 RepID=A0A317W3Q9_ASPEC|nr:6-hydroxy-D-nicotine oxidase [Aspergillus eucalypticola CBS 122712]PWY81204.1 6-hydroxy-D-nicotine oxidase [Aspergillus eucalypticola CBS 122712]
MAAVVTEIVANACHLEQEKVTHIETLLSRFDSLSAAEQDQERASYVTTVFPLFFGAAAVVHGSNGYEPQRIVPWSTNCWLQPRVIVRPGSAQQVAAALALCRFFHVRFSIRGGGHLQIPGFTSNQDGVVISLGAFNQVRVAENKSTAGIGVGLRWLEVYRRLEQHGVAVAGGRVPSVGVSGLLLGGGISFQNSQYGVGAMGVCNYEVVLANSQIINANARENPDLFWALKGGGPNFGIVTKIEMNTIPNQIWTEVRIYPLTAADQLRAALMQYHDAIETDNKASLIWNATNDIILIVYVYCAPIENPWVFQAFYDIPHFTSFVPPGIRTVYDLVQAVASVNEAEPTVHEFRTMSSRPSLEVYKAIEQAHAEQAEALKDVEGIALTTVIQPMSSFAMRESLKNGGSPLGLEPVGQQWFLARADWKNIQDEERVREAVRKIVDAAESAAKRTGVYLPYKYSNYAAWDQDPLASYGAENVRRLKEVARKYDPEAVFQTLQNGGWLLSKVGME